MADNETERPILRITGKDPLTGVIDSGEVDAIRLTGKRSVEIMDECLHCPANIERALFTQEGRDGKRPYSCRKLTYEAEKTVVHFAPPAAGAPADTNVTLFLGEALCRPILSGSSDSPTFSTSPKSP